MAAKTILFPTDFSTASDAALSHAETLAKQAGAKMLIVHVDTTDSPSPIPSGFRRCSRM